MSLEVTAAKRMIAEEGSAPRWMGHLLRFGDGTGDVPMLVFATDGLDADFYAEVLRDPGALELPGDFVSALAESRLPAVDLLLISAEVLPQVRAEDGASFTSFFEAFLARFRSHRPTTVAFLGAGQGCALATYAAIATRESCALAGFVGSGVEDLVLMAKAAPRRAPWLLPARFYGDSEAFEPVSGFFQALPRRRLQPSCRYIGSLGSAAASLIGWIETADARRHRPSLRPVFEVVRAPLDAKVVGEERLAIPGNQPDVSFAPVGEKKVRLVDVPTKAREVRVRWFVKPNAVGLRIDGPGEAFRLRLRVQPDVSLIASYRRDRWGRCGRAERNGTWPDVATAPRLRANTRSRTSFGMRWSTSNSCPSQGAPWQ